MHTPTTLHALALRQLGRLFAEAPTARPAASVAASRPTMAGDRWGTIVDVAPARVGDKFVLGRIRFRADDGSESTYLVQRGQTYMSFNWLDDRGTWQRRRASFAELRVGMRAEVWGDETGAAESVLVEGLPRITA